MYISFLTMDCGKKKFFFKWEGLNAKIPLTLSSIILASLRNLMNVGGREERKRKEMDTKSIPKGKC